MHFQLGEWGRHGRRQIGDGGAGKGRGEGKYGRDMGDDNQKDYKKNHNDNSNKSTLNIHCYAMLLHTQRASFRTFFAVYFGADPGFV